MGHKIRSKKKTTIVLHFENEPKEINTLEEIEIMKVTTSDHMLNIMKNNNPLYQILQPL
jgi:hypothetical protein